jgi:2-hydroxychromene-2-carboxylate isomerase
MADAPRLDFWFEFASTYSYPAAMRIGALAEASGVTVRWRPFLLGPVFKAQGWDNSPFNIYPSKGRYMWRDLERICGALADNWGENYCRAVYDAEFGGGHTLSDVATIAGLLSGPGQDPESVLAQAQSDEIKSALRAQTEEAQRIGIFGAPSFVTADGELFWGNDRLETAIAWAQ